MISVLKTTQARWNKFFYYFRLILGFAIIYYAFGILFWFGQWQGPALLASQSKVISADQITKDPSLQGQLVWVTGPFTSKELVSDDLFLTGKYIGINRRVQVYAWEESDTSDTDIPNYIYDKNWYNGNGTNLDSKRFAHPEGHMNPAQLIHDAEIPPKSLSVGAYSIGDVDALYVLPYYPIALSEKNTNLSGSRAVIARVDQEYTDYIFVPTATSKGTISNPEVGDIKISYSTTFDTNTTTTIIGRLDGDKISPYFYKSDSYGHCPSGSDSGAGCPFYVLVPGNETRDEYLSELYVQSHSYFAGLVQVEGFVCMFVGILIVLFSVIEIIPFRRWVSVVSIPPVSFVVSLALSELIPGISKRLHSHGTVHLAIAVIVVMIVNTIFCFVYRRNKR